MMPGLGIGIVVLAVLLAASIATFRVAKLLGIPVMISLVIAGLVAEAILPPRIHIELGPEVLALCLPALIFEAAWDCDAAVLRGVALQVTLLAVPGVFATTAIFALAATFSGIVAWPAALVLGAIVAATDPVAVLAIFRRLGLPERLTAIVEGESVANDGVAIVLVSALVGFAVSGTLADGVLGTVAFMVYEAAAGIAIGAGVALCAGYVMRARIGVSGWVAVSLVVAYGAYAIAGAAHASGIFATAAAGMTLRARVAADRYGPGARAVDRAWDVLAFVANVALFVLVGLTLRLEVVFGEPGLFVACAIAAVVARALIAYLFVPLRGLTREPMAWHHAIALSGLRGGLSLALALSLPPEMPSREAVIDAVFAVVFLTLVVQGSAVGPLIERLGIGGPRRPVVEGSSRSKP
jgi:monovalent cation:H+ antiporter, CPA1 family